MVRNHPLDNWNKLCHSEDMRTSADPYRDVIRMDRLPTVDELDILQAGKMIALGDGPLRKLVTCERSDYGTWFVRKGDGGVSMARSARRALHYMQERSR